MNTQINKISRCLVLCCFITITFLSDLQAAEGNDNAIKSKVNTEIECIIVAIKEHKEVVGCYPNSHGIAWELCNREVKFIEWDKERIDEKGNFLDLWGNPFKVEIFTSSSEISVRSAGPNGIFYDDDDKFVFDNDKRRLDVHLPLVPNAHTEAVSKVEVEIDNLIAAIRLYHLTFKKFPNEKIPAEELCGKNSRKKSFILWDKKRINKKGEFLDPWGNPYKIEMREPGEISIRSAGENGVLNDEDDKFAEYLPGDRK